MAAPGIFRRAGKKGRGGMGCGEPARRRCEGRRPEGL